MERIRHMDCDKLLSSLGVTQVCHELFDWLLVPFVKASYELHQKEL